MAVSARTDDGSGDQPKASKAPRQRRGRPSRKAAAAIDAQVLESARICFLAGGFNGATMDAIAQHAGVTKVTLYQRYADKVALLRAVMQDRIATWSTTSQQRIAARGDTVDQRLRYYARSVLRWSTDKEIRAFGDLIRGCWGSAPAVAEEMEALRLRRMLDVLEADILEFSGKEGLTIKQPRQLAEMFLGMLAAFSPPSAAGDAVDDAIAAYADRTVDVLMNGRRAW